MLFVLEEGILRVIIYFACVIGVLIILLYDTRCPYCHHHGLSPHLTWKNAGCCRFCGERTYYKEFQDEDWANHLIQISGRHLQLHLSWCTLLIWKGCSYEKPKSHDTPQNRQSTSSPHHVHRSPYYRPRDSSGYYLSCMHCWLFCAATIWDTLPLLPPFRTLSQHNLEQCRLLPLLRRANLLQGIPRGIFGVNTPAHPS